MIAKLRNNTADTGFSMTHKPSKFASSFGAEGSQIVSKKGKNAAPQAKASPEPVAKQPVVKHSSRAKPKKSSKKNSARKHDQSPASHQEEEQKVIQQA